jgi:hypothetical protein
MKNMFKAFMGVFIFLMIGCGNNSKQEQESPKNEYEIIQEQAAKRDTLNKMNVQNLLLKHDVLLDWGQYAQYTCDLQAFIDTTTRFLSYKGEIRDVVTRGDSFVILLDGSYAPEKNDKHRYSGHRISDIFILPEIYVPKEKLNDLKQLMQIDYYAEIFFIINPIKVIPMRRLQIDSEASGNEENDDLESWVTYDMNETCVVLQAELIDYYIYQKNASKGIPK